MPPNGEKTKWLISLTGILLTIIIAVVSYTGNIVRANEVRSTEDRKRIRAEMKQDKRDVLSEIKEIRKEQTIMAIQIARILTILEKDELK